MWMVLRNGTWQPADDGVVIAWIRNGAIGPTTQIRHASWTAPKRLDEVQGFRHYLDPTSAPVMSTPIVIRQPAADHDPNRWLKMVAIGAVVFLAGLGTVGAASTAHPVVGVIAIIVGMLVVALLVAPSLWKAAPPPVATAARVLRRHKGGTSLVAAALLLGGAGGLQRRAERVAACERSTSSAIAARASGRPSSEVAAAFGSAAIACKAARMAAEASRAADEQTSALERAREEAAQARAEEHQAKLVAARADATGGSATTAITNFADAEKLGALSKADQVLFAEQLVGRARSEIASGDYAAAIASLEEAKKRDDLAEGVDALLADARAREKRRVVDAALAAAKTVASSECVVADDIRNAWDGLRAIEKSDAQYKAAKKVAVSLEKCRKKAIKFLVDGVRTLMKAQRQQIATEYENSLLSEGLDVRVRLSGKHKTKLTIEYILLNRAWAYKITDGGSTAPGSFLGNLEGLGFTRVTFSDGWGESYYYDLDPETEESAAAATTGIGSPFKL